MYSYTVECKNVPDPKKPQIPPRPRLSVLDCGEVVSLFPQAHRPLELPRHPGYRERGDRRGTDHQPWECCGAGKENRGKRVLPRVGAVRVESSRPRVGETKGGLDAEIS
jgi:hypothetical protein